MAETDEKVKEETKTQPPKPEDKTVPKPELKLEDIQGAFEQGKVIDVGSGKQLGDQRVLGKDRAWYRRLIAWYRRLIDRLTGR